jgi:hypothetical protein
VDHKNTGNAYDITHAAVVGGALARYRRDAPMAIHNALSARRSAEHQALVAYHFYAMAVEAAARVDAGEVHAATLLATTALGAVEATRLRVRSRDPGPARTPKRAASPQAPAPAAW